MIAFQRGFGDERKKDAGLTSLEGIVTTRFLGNHRQAQNRPVGDPERNSYPRIRS